MSNKRIDIEKWTSAEKVVIKKITHGLYRGSVRPARQGRPSRPAQSHITPADDFKSNPECSDTHSSEIV